MKGLKVIDAGVNPEYGATFGTCEFCYWTGDVANPWMELEFPDGTTRKIDTYYWEWGEYEEAPNVNVVDFSAWLQEQELDQDALEQGILEEFGTHQLMNLIESYDREKRGRID